MSLILIEQRVFDYSNQFYFRLKHKYLVNLGVDNHCLNNINRFEICWISTDRVPTSMSAYIIELLRSILVYDRDIKVNSF